MCPAFAALESVSFDVPWSIASVRALLDDGLTRVWVARTSSTIVGAALAARRRR